VPAGHPYRGHSLRLCIRLPALRLQNEKSTGIHHGINTLKELYQSLIAIVNVDPLGKRETGTTGLIIAVRVVWKQQTR